jgi:hypothetical protein
MDVARVVREVHLCFDRDRPGWQDREIYGNVKAQGHAAQVLAEIG